MRIPLADGDAVVAVVLREQVAERGQVRPDPLHDPLLLGRVGDRDFDRAVEPQLAVADALQGLDRALQDVVGGQHAVADSGSGSARSAWPRRFPAARLSSGIWPICIRYMRTGSSVASTHASSSPCGSCLFLLVVKARLVSSSAAAKPLAGFVRVREAVVVRQAVAVDGLDLVSWRSPACGSSWPSGRLLPRCVANACRWNDQKQGRYRQPQGRLGGERKD